MSDSETRAVRGGGTKKGEVWGIAAEGKLKLLEAFLIAESSALRFAF